MRPGCPSVRRPSVKPILPERHLTPGIALTCSSARPGAPTGALRPPVAAATLCSALRAARAELARLAEGWAYAATCDSMIGPTILAVVLSNSSRGAAVCESPPLPPIAWHVKARTSFQPRGYTKTEESGTPRIKTYCMRLGWPPFLTKATHKTKARSKYLIYSSAFRITAQIYM
jgi:hypothetical protein